MTSSVLRSVTVAVILILGVVGCSGSGANQSDPAGAVKAALEAAQSGGIAKLSEFACAASKDEVANMFSGAGGGSLAGLGISGDDVAGAMKIEFKDIQTSEKSRTGDSAVVHITGTTNITFDAAKLRDLMKKVMEGQGQTIDDATLDTMIASMTTGLGQSQAMDSDVKVVQEGGKWVICE
jgi:hypothetical protein